MGEPHMGEPHMGEPHMGEPHRLTVNVLGPLEISVDGHPVHLTANRLRTLLTALAMSAGTTVSMERLADTVWSDRLPANCRRSLQNYAARLRTTLGSRWIHTQPGGVLLRAHPDDVDALRFARILDQAARTQDPHQERHLLDQALTLTRGEPFEDVPSRRLRETEAPRLTERHLLALERRIDLDLDLELATGPSGHHALLAELKRWTTRCPLRESLWLRLLKVLDRQGRRAEALERYEQLRTHLADDLGINPGPELQRLYAHLLVDQPPAPPTRPAPTPHPTPHPTRYPTPPPTPRQLPPDLADFTGRTRELTLTDTLTHGPQTVCVIEGMAGTGKTALTLHAAHRLAHRFPDGQLFVHLHGHSPGRTPLHPHQALRLMLTALGTPRHHIPPHTDDRAGLLRTLLADRATLIVLDDATDATQILPLLPGNPHCRVLITSRRRLTPLDATRTITLHDLPPTDATTLFTRAAAPHPPSATPAQLHRTVTRCALLPLAIRLAATRLRTHPTWDISHLLARLTPPHHRLDELTDGHRSVETALDQSYRQLPEDQRRAYRLLATLPNRDIPATTAATLLGTDPPTAETLLDQLADTHLLSEPAPGLWRMHDLAHDHAHRLAARLATRQNGTTSHLIALTPHH
ncbi:BTAD domain-containing putative transcriptional regulator [Nonomuraea sp. NPDC048826]|uniref:AfsR/SARP family transcriptional regulator n=1 Tax=Nonomuraea sp. NPDC048826 TaxID=3364347 RepID=UPI00372055DA